MMWPSSRRRASRRSDRTATATLPKTHSVAGPIGRVRCRIAPRGASMSREAGRRPADRPGKTTGCGPTRPSEVLRHPPPASTASRQQAHSRAKRRLEHSPIHRPHWPHNNSRRYCPRRHGGPVHRSPRGSIWLPGRRRYRPADCSFSPHRAHRQRHFSSVGDRRAALPSPTRKAPGPAAENRHRRLPDHAGRLPPTSRAAGAAPRKHSGVDSFSS